MADSGFVSSYFQSPSVHLAMGSPNMCHRLFVCFGIIKKVLGSAMRDGIRNGDVAGESILA